VQVNRRELLDTTGLKCPEPVLRLAVKSVEMKPGDILDIVGDCPTFARDIDAWCTRMQKTLLFTTDHENGKVKCQIRF
jgi:tRNA 2-thiouridine synthesizing protein A